jgi:oligosaccharyl transferase (archaeosortase A-associated)
LQTSRFRTYLITGIILLIIFGIALYFRIALPYNKVFVGDWIKYTGSDAYYFMRYVDNFVHNFPHFIQFDPYLRFPQGYMPGNEFFAIVMGAITWLSGLGSPSAHMVDIIGVYFPAVVCSLAVIPIFFIGKALFNRWVGLIAAGLLAVMPGESLGRTILGYTDRDALEILLALIAMLFMILMVKSILNRDDNQDTQLRFSWHKFKIPLIYSILTGIFLGLFLLTWRGAFVFVILFCIYIIVQTIIDYSRDRNTGYLCASNTVSLLITFIIFLFVAPAGVYLASMLLALAIPAIMGILAYILKRFKIRTLYFVLILIFAAIAFLGIFYAVNSKTFAALFTTLLGTFVPDATRLTIMEMQPILFPGGQFSFAIIWLNFTTGAILCLIALYIIIRGEVKDNQPDRLLLIVWSLVMLVVMLMIRRFALLFTINVALLTAYVGWLILKYAGFREQTQESPAQIRAADEPHLTKKQERKAARKKPKPKPRSGNLAVKIVALVFVLLLLFLPDFIYAGDTAGKVYFAPGDAWYDSLNWLKDNTPEPFEGADPYNKAYDARFEYPENSYAVVSWWDYGYRILRIGNRPTNCDPGGGKREQVAKFLAAQDQASANNILNGMRSKYIVIDDLTALPTKFYAVATYAGKTPADFFELYYQKKGNMLEPVPLFYPEYYMAMSTRLYNFDGAEVIPTLTQVVSYSDKIDGDGNPYKEIISLDSFTDYNAAVDFLHEHGQQNYRIVGTNPFISPVPLEAANSYQLIYSSKDSTTQTGVGRVSTIKIFEYVE